MSQQHIIDRIAAMLADERTERRCAAAMVLAELRVKDAGVVQQLCNCLQEPNTTLQLYALEALAAARAKKIAGAVTPLLDAADDEVRARATALLASQGSRAAVALTRELAGAPLARRRAIVQIMARHHGKETFERLLQLLPDPELGELVVHTLRAELEQMSDADGKALREALVQLLKNRRWTADPKATAHAVRLLGYHRDAKLVSIVLGFLGDKQPVPVRLAALAALRRPLKAGRPPAAAVQNLLQCADDPDPGVARAAIETLRGVELRGESAAALSTLSQGRHGETRRFAIEALGRLGDGKVIKTLVAHLSGDDPAARDAAGRALAHLEGAAPALVKELSDALEDPARLERLCRLLRPHASGLTPAARKALAELALGTLERGHPAATLLLDLLRVADPKSYAALLSERAERMRKGKKFEQAFTMLCRLEDSGLIEDEGRFAALVSGLHAVKSKKELGRASRTTDPVLRQAVKLVAVGYPVASKLKKDRMLTPEDLFFVGFNFAESRDEDEREFGGELLGHLAAKSPRSKLGRSARNKLRLVGLEA